MAEDKKPVRVTYTKELESILKELEDANNYVAFELLWLGEVSAKYHNGLRIETVNVSKKKNSFDVTIDGKISSMPISNFIKYYFKSLLGNSDVNDFLRMYNSLSAGEPIDGKLIKVEDFKYNPKDVRSTFLSLVTKTYPHGHEDEVLEFLPELDKDIVGNYYKIIGGGNPQTMFTSHLDTADRSQKVTKLYSSIEEGEEYIITDGNSILGADDKSGVAVMLYMMAHDIPGLYYFFIGEERGGIGSGMLSSVYDDVDYLKDIKRCISFDRRNYHSVITSQLGKVCCSNDFGTALCKEYNKQGMDLSLDPTGVYTDSASFLEEISECTNVSVGYMYEHTADEYQNITYLEKLAKASIGVNWDSLPTVRKIGLDEEVLRKHGALISDLKKSEFAIDVRVMREQGGGISVQCDLEDGAIEEIYDSLTALSVILRKYKIEQDAFFDETYLKIELK
jgi:hypothetical protein